MLNQYKSTIKSHSCRKLKPGDFTVRHVCTRGSSFRAVHWFLKIWAVHSSPAMVKFLIFAICDFEKSKSSPKFYCVFAQNRCSCQLICTSHTSETSHSWPWSCFSHMLMLQFACVRIHCLWRDLLASKLVENVFLWRRLKKFEELTKYGAL